MLKKDDFFKAGVINKPKGVMGEINFACLPNVSIPNQFYDFLFIDIEGYLVPYKVEEMSWNADNRGHVKFEDVTSNEQAAKITGYYFFIPLQLVEEDGLETTFDYLTGYHVFNEEMVTIGEVSDFMDIPGNPVLVVNKGKDEILIPFNEDLIMDIKPEDKTIQIKIPDGLL